MAENPLTPFSTGAVGFFRRLFGPAATELGEILADKVRAYRAKNLEKVLETAQARIGALATQELPLRFSIPFFEKASLDDDTDLIERWANLLVSATLEYKPENLAFIDILARLSPTEAKILEAMVPQEIETEAESPGPEYATFTWHMVGRREAVSQIGGVLSKVSFRDGKLSADGRAIIEAVVNMDLGMIIESIAARAIDIDDHSEWFQARDGLDNDMISLDILISTGLAARTTLFQATRDVSVTASVVAATALGFEFVKACRGDRVRAAEDNA